MLDLLANAVQYFEEFERLLHVMNEPLKVLDNAIKNSSERLKGEDNDLEDCLTVCNTSFHRDYFEITMYPPERSGRVTGQ